MFRLRPVRTAATLTLALGLAALPACSGTGETDGSGETGDTAAAEIPTLSAEAEAGRAVAESKGCVACHSLDGTSRAGGPTLLGVAGSERKLTNGTTVIADEDYLRRAILEPDAERLEGYPTRMPKMPVTDTEVESLLALMAELR